MCCGGPAAAGRSELPEGTPTAQVVFAAQGLRAHVAPCRSPYTPATMVASAVYILDLKGKILISRNYRGDIPKSAAERWVLRGVKM